MATELETLAANLKKVSDDLGIIVPLVGTLKSQVVDLTTQLAAAKAAGFDVPDEIINTSNDLVTQADAAVASLQDNTPTTVTVTDAGGGTSGNP